MAPRLDISGIRKSYGATQALRGVDLRVGAGEVHALIGENGAGKSTLMKILSGAERPDDGMMALDGAAYRPGDPLAARHRGVAMIYQELNLAPHLTVEENITLGAEPARMGWIRRSSRSAAAREALSQLDYAHLPLGQPVSQCTMAEKQIVEIARALLHQPRVLILDEPTSSLTHVDTQRLFRVIRRLRDRGVSVIYISHFLEECQQVCERFTVLRDGQTVGGGDLSSASIGDIVRLMVGREVSEIYPRSPRTPGEVVLEVKGLAAGSKPHSASFELRRGEILGVAGLVGAGRTEMARACFGLDRVTGGRVAVWSREHTHSNPSERLRDRVGFLSENRKEEGLLLQRSIADNLMLTRYSPTTRWGFIRRRLQATLAGDSIRQLGVRSRDCWQSVGQLSGGNQQKVFLGRLIHHQAEILLLDEPTRGIDVGSKAEIYRLIQSLAGQGKAVLFISSYLPELMGVCDTLAVMCRGSLGAKRPVCEWTEHAVIEAALGRGME